MTLYPAFIEGLGGGEMILILFVVLMLFGADKLPELARGFGKSMREFKKAASGVEEEVRRALEEEPEPKRPALATAKPPGTVQSQPVNPDPQKSDAPPSAGPLNPT